MLQCWALVLWAGSVSLLLTPILPHTKQENLGQQLLGACVPNGPGVRAQGKKVQFQIRRVTSYNLVSLRWLGITAVMKNTEKLETIQEERACSLYFSKPYQKSTV